MQQCMGTRDAARRDWVAIARPVLAVGYGAVIVSCFTSTHAPCVFWTMLMPLAPAVVVLAGFHTWRRLCPLAQLGELGARRAPPRRRGLRRLERAVMPVSFALLAGSLAVRLLVVNGDPYGLGCLLAGLGLLAIVVNRGFGGRTWCNYLCPVGVVERIYTDAGALRPTPTSRCTSCVGCKRGCPDIDQDRAYRGDVLGRGRRLAWFGFPGLVLSFYAYYPLRAGTWDAYFDGRWTESPAGWALLLGPGFAFAPHIPALVAAPVTLLAGTLASVCLFDLVERVVRLHVRERESARHVVLSLAAFSAFATFYWFAGQPTLRTIPFASTAVRVVLPLVAVCVLARRIARPTAAGVRQGRPRPLPVIQ